MSESILTLQGDRQKAANNGATAAVSGMAGAVVAGAITARNPEHAELAVLAGGLTTGLLAALGNTARSSGGLFSWLFGWF